MARAYYEVFPDMFINLNDEDNYPLLEWDEQEKGN